MPEWFWPGAATATWLGFLVGLVADMIRDLVEDW